MTIFDSSHTTKAAGEIARCHDEENIFVLGLWAKYENSLVATGLRSYIWMSWKKQYFIVLLKGSDICQVLPKINYFDHWNELAKEKNKWNEKNCMFTISIIA